MNRIKDYENLEIHILEWMSKYLKESGMKGWVLGVSGGLDSAVVSTLAAKSGVPVMLLEMPIKQGEKQVARAFNHIKWLKENFINVQSREIDMNFKTTNFVKINVFEAFITQIENGLDGLTPRKEKSLLAEANTRSRMRMMMLYYFASLNNYLVLGTGNKVEDFGVGFYTKYGDGGVDLSPIADLYKTEVRHLGRQLGVSEEILEAVPTDGLWDDSRTDEQQLGATYENLEWAMEYLWEQNKGVGTTNPNEIHELHNNMIYMYSSEQLEDDLEEGYIVKEQYNAVKILVDRYERNQHKMNPIPVCEIPNSNLRKIRL